MHTYYYRTMSITLVVLLFVGCHPQQPADIVIELDRSRSMVSDITHSCNDVRGVAQFAIGTYARRKGSTISVIATGDERTGYAPIQLLKATDIQFSGRILHGRNNKRVEREALLNRIEMSCRSVIHPALTSPIFVTTQLVIEQAQSAQQRNQHRAVLIVMSDLQETAEAAIKRELKKPEGRGASGTELPKFHAAGVEILICGYGGTKATVTGHLSSASLETTRRVWSPIFESAKSVAWSPWCPGANTGNDASIQVSRR